MADRGKRQRAALYARSSAKADKAIQDLIDQINRLFRDAMRSGWKGYEFAIPGESAVSGLDATRPALTALLDLIKTGAVSAIFVADVTRLTSSLIEWSILLDKCAARDVDIVVNGRILTRTARLAASRERPSRSRVRLP
jgi:DNA invertase Pin-like site-specific DNA recombinase